MEFSGGTYFEKLGIKWERCQKNNLNMGDIIYGRHHIMNERNYPLMFPALDFPIREIKEFSSYIITQPFIHYTIFSDMKSNNDT